MLLGKKARAAQAVSWRVRAMRYVILLVTTTILMVLVVSCQRESTHIYVPGPQFTETLTISAAIPKDRDLKVGKWLELNATRSTGPWMKVHKSKKSNYKCWWLRPPLEVEKNVQSNVRWHVEPNGGAVFNLPGAGDLFKRSVRFTQPGSYRLSATSAGCGKPFHSNNVIEITVQKTDVIK